MKKLVSVFALTALIFAGATESQAQESFVSVGLELGLPTGDWAEDVFGFTVGASAEFEYGVSDNLGVNVSAGYQILTLDDKVTDFVKSAALIPIQVGANYYLDEARSGLFFGAKVGIHMYSLSTEDIDLGPFGTFEGESNTETYLSLAPQAGFFLTDNISLALRYQMFFIPEDKDAGVKSDTGSYLGLRAAYNF